MKTLLRVVCLLLVEVSSAMSQDAPRQSYTRIDRAWVDGLNMTGENVTARLARALAGFEGKSVDDGCGCKVGLGGEIIDPVHCPSVFKTHDEKMARARAVPIITPSDWAFNLTCFREGDQMCRKNGVSYVGETCCKMVSDVTFHKIKSDLNFYVILPEPIAAKISAYGYRETSSMRPVDQTCSIMVDEKARAWSLAPEWRGFVARAWLYADRHYGANTPLALGVLRKIAEQNPPQQWEIQRDKLIGTTQGGRVNDETVKQ